MDMADKSRRLVDSHESSFGGSVAASLRESIGRPRSSVFDIQPIQQQQKQNQQHQQHQHQQSQSATSRDSAREVRSTAAKRPRTPTHGGRQDGSIAEGLLSPRNPHFPLLAPTAGQKRTASGEVKAPAAVNNSLPTSPVHAISPSRRVRAGVASNGSSVEELTHQLRARLSYAMIKVQNGWESRSLNEVETMAALHSPATPALHGLAHTLALPSSSSSAYARLRRDGSDLSQKSGDSTLPNSPHISNALLANESLNGQHHQHQQQQQQHQQQQQRTYESFWRDHGSSSSSSANNPVSRILQARISLAPPADIIPARHPRRTHSSQRTHPPPSLPTTTQPRYPTTATTHTTPPHTPALLMRTPSQKTAMEQEAVESLIFMSSPGNSAHAHPSLSTALSPAQRAPPPSFSSTPSASSSLSSSSSVRQRAHQNPVGKDTGAAARPQTALVSARALGRSLAVGRGVDPRTGDDEIDRLLDCMDEGASEDEDVVLDVPRGVGGAGVGLGVGV
ncbi:MAG: hypothetical protein M1829_002213 [Trizodia sp. TS-e1964]|nr:MAG: hypothetical protein M1829_002213 [Trizodia sp. TS-e1964]